MLLNTDSVSSSSRLQCFWILIQCLYESLFLYFSLHRSGSPLDQPARFLHLTCYKHIFYPFGSPFTSQLHGESMSQGLIAAFQKFKSSTVSNIGLCERGNGKETGRSYFFLLNCSKGEILHGICPETCRTAPAELSMNSPLGLIVKKWPVLQLGTLHFPHTLWLCFPSSSSSLSMISPPDLSSCPYFLSLFLGSQEHTD